MSSYLLDTILGRRKNAARIEAIKLGITVDVVIRECPFFNRNNSKVSLEACQCTKYTVQRQLRGEPADWFFLQRTPNEGAQYAHGWLFISAAGRPSVALERELTKIAEEWEDEFLEFEGTPTEVSAFWDEWGSRAIVARIHGYLQALAAV